MEIDKIDEDLTSTTTTTDTTNDTTNTNLTDLSSSDLVSNVDTSSYLYSSGLQSIFDDYQSSVASLEASKQEDIEDAYYIKEISKKYLGEYASNNDMFDVSGNLLSIYGNYQDNITSINTNYSDLQYNLDQAYSDSVDAYNQESAFGEISYNLSTGLIPDGMTELEYIESVRDTLGESYYWELMTSYKGLEMTETIDSALSSFRDYETQEDWDVYIESLLESGKINNTQAEYLIGQWEAQGNVNFTLNTNYSGNDISYYNPNNSDIVSGGKYYTSANGEYTLAETNNVIYSDHPNYDTILEDAREAGNNTPFTSNGSWYVMDSSGEIKEYVYAETSISTYSGTFSQEENEGTYDYLSSYLGGQSGNVGNVHYEYDSDNDTYSAYLNYNTISVGNQKGSIQIGASEYSFSKDDVIDNGKITSLASNISGLNKVSFNDVYNGDDLAATVLQEMARVYFNGSSDELFKSVGNNEYSKDSTYVVTISGKYYTISSGRIYELQKS